MRLEVALEVVRATQHVGGGEIGRIARVVGADVEGDRFARKQRDEAFLNGRLVVDLADHAEQVTHVVVRGDGEFHAVGGALGLGRERVGRGIELLREDFGRVVDHAGEGIVGRHGNR